MISPTVLEIQGFQKSQKDLPSLIIEKYCPDCSVQHLLSISSSDKYIKRISTQVKTFWRPLAPDKLFSKTVLPKYLKNRLRYRKKLRNQICRSFNFTSTRIHLFFDIFNSFRDIRVQRIATPPPSPNYGEILVRLYCLGEVFDSTPIATYTKIFIQIGQLIRKISTDKLFRTD